MPIITVISVKILSIYKLENIQTGEIGPILCNNLGNLIKTEVEGMFYYIMYNK